MKEDVGMTCQKLCKQGGNDSVQVNVSIQSHTSLHHSHTTVEYHSKGKGVGITHMHYAVHTLILCQRIQPF